MFNYGGSFSKGSAYGRRPHKEREREIFLHVPNTVNNSEEWKLSH